MSVCVCLVSLVILHWHSYRSHWNVKRQPHFYVCDGAMTVLQLGENSGKLAWTQRLPFIKGFRDVFILYKEN